MIFTPPRTIPAINDESSFIAKPNARHYKWIDVLRAISALLILLFHYTYRYNTHPLIVGSCNSIDYPIQISWGYGAVITFFMLSGYLISNNFFNPSIRPLQFIKKRILRLYPTFWVSLILTSLGMSVLFPEVRIGIVKFIANMSMVPLDFHQGYIDGAYWTMAYEIKFTSVIFLIIIFRNLTIRNSLLVVWLISSIAVGLFQTNLHPILIFAMKEIFIMDLLQAFIMGIAVAGLRKDWKFNTMIFALCCINQYCWLKEDVVYNLFFVGTLLFLTFLPIIEKVRINDRLYLIMEFIALISYPLYLLHQNLGYGILRILFNNGLTSELWVLVPIIGSVLLAYIIHEYIELPTSKLDFKSWPKLITRYSKH